MDLAQSGAEAAIGGSAMGASEWIALGALTVAILSGGVAGISAWRAIRSDRRLQMLQFPVFVIDRFEGDDRGISLRIRNINDRIAVDVTMALEGDERELILRRLPVAGQYQGIAGKGDTITYWSPMSLAMWLHLGYEGEFLVITCRDVAGEERRQSLRLSPIQSRSYRLEREAKEKQSKPPKQ